LSIRSSRRLPPISFFYSISFCSYFQFSSFLLLSHLILTRPLHCSYSLLIHCVFLLSCRPMFFRVLPLYSSFCSCVVFTLSMILSPILTPFNCGYPFYSPPLLRAIFRARNPLRFPPPFCPNVEVFSSSSCFFFSECFSGYAFCGLSPPLILPSFSYVVSVICMYSVTIFVSLYLCYCSFLPL